MNESDSDRSFGRKLRDAYADGGVRAVLGRSLPYLHLRHVRPHLPMRTVRLNRYRMPIGRLFDASLPWVETDRPGYESGLVDSIDEYVQKGDEVVIVGGGHGVTALAAAEKVTSKGSVIVYEGAANSVDLIRRIVKNKGVADRVQVRHAVVGEPRSLRGDRGDARAVSPHELPGCDVLELDCEGTEMEILPALNIRPRAMLVETHGMHNAPSEAVASELSTIGYRIRSEAVADSGRREKCLQDDIIVITAVER